ncbi:MAG: hypothetical protein HRT87_10020, partial [Legionellales bacterium]|nr:hypothetical protein [Legionellales bacterium]
NPEDNHLCNFTPLNIFYTLFKKSFRFKFSLIACSSPSYKILIYAVREGARILALKNASINQAEKIVKENLSNNGFDTRKITLLSYDNDPSCKKNISTIHMEVKIPIQDILITGDPFGIFINKKFLFASTDMKKECIRKYEKK